MSQLRRNARLASIRARAAQSSSVPEPIFLDNDNTDSLCFPPRDSPGCIKCGLELELGGDAHIFSCCFSSRHLQCLVPLVEEVDQEVLCPDCPHQSVDHVSACLARSFSSRGLDCPFCNQSFAFFANSSSFLASFFFHGCMVDLDRAPSNQAIDSFVVPDDFPPPPPIYPFCCARVGGPPDFEPLDDRRMEWSPLHPSSAHGATSWVPQWVCRSCEHPLRFLTSLRWMQLHVLCVPLHLQSCLTNLLLAVRFCVLCQHVVPHDSTVANQVVSSPPSSVDPPRLVLASFVFQFIVWGSSRPSPPSSESWFFCPLVSLGLALAESNRGIPLYSTGSREQVPPNQSLFCTHASHIIQVCATAAIALQSWQGGHLNTPAQELVTPPDIFSMMSVWSEAVVGFSSRSQAARLPSSAPPVHVSSPPVSPPSPFSVVSHSPAVPPSLFASL